MAKLTPAVTLLRKGVDPVGRPVRTYEDVDESGTPTERTAYQGVVLVDAYGVPVARDTTAGSDPVKINVTDSAIVTLAALNATRFGILIIHQGATIWMGLNNLSGNVANFKASAFPWFATAPFPPAP